MPVEIKNFSDCQKLLAKEASNIFAVGLSAYHALGLLELIPEANVICLEDDGLVDNLLAEGKSIFCLEREIGDISSFERNTKSLLWHEKTQSFVRKKTKNPKLYFSHSSIAIESLLADDSETTVLNADAKTSRSFENKILFWKLLEENSIHNPSRGELRVSPDNLKGAGWKFGWPLVVQSSLGIAGAGTEFLDENEVRGFARDSLNKKVLVSEYIKGKTVTLNAVVSGEKVVVGEPFLQITGEGNLNANIGGTGGNDYGVELNLSQDQKGEIISVTKKVGRLMKEKGFKGLFGLDFIVDGNGEIFLIECNARPPASVPTYTQIESQTDVVSLLGLHLLEFLDIPFGVEENPQFALEGSKLILRNTEDCEVMINSNLKAGAYNRDLEFVRTETNFTKLDPGEILVFPGKKGNKVNPNIELAIVHYPESVFEPNGKLQCDVLKLIQRLREKLLSE